MIGQAVGGANGCSHARDVVWHPPDFNLDGFSDLDRQQRPGGARIAVFGFPDAAVIDEQDTLNLTDPRFMGVPENEDGCLRTLRDPCQRARVTVFK